MLLLLTLEPTRQQPFPYKGLICSLLSSPHWQDPSIYNQLRTPRGLAQVPSRNTFLEKVESASTPKSEQQESANDQFIGTSSQSKTPMNSSLQRGSKFPVRPSEPDCPFYVQTGDCKFGAGCRFNHPRVEILRTPDHMLKSPAGLPLRPGELPCFFYYCYGFCKYGSTCKFDHPLPASMGIVTDSPSISAASDVPPVQQPTESSSGIPASTLSSESSAVAGPSEVSRLPSTNSEQMNSDDENVESG